MANFFANLIGSGAANLVDSIGDAINKNVTTDQERLELSNELAKAQLLWGDADTLNKVPGWVQAVTVADLQRVARTYLTAGNRTVIDRVPAAMAPARGIAPPAPPAPAAAPAQD